MAFSSATKGRTGDLFHHQVAVPAGKILRPFNSFDVIIEVLGAFREIRQVLVRQVDEKFLHVLAGHFDEVAAHAVAYSSRTAVQHKPDAFRFIEADFDEVVAGAQRSEMIRMIAPIELRMLFENGVITRLERLPNFVVTPFSKSIRSSIGAIIRIISERW